MYPKRFTFDPRLIERARIVTLRSPDLNVLRDENWAELPGLAHFLEQGFKARDAEGKLLLPDLSALANWTVGIFSDYGGEDSTSRFFTYSFLVCAFGSLEPFKQQMAARGLSRCPRRPSRRAELTLRGFPKPHEISGWANLV